MTPPSWAPTTDQVAALLRARTRGPGSRDAATAAEQGRFTDATRPTDDQVAELIELACNELLAALRGHTLCTTNLELAATTAAAYRAAMLVEISYHPEATNGDRTAFSALSELWSDARDALAETSGALCPLESV